MPALTPEQQRIVDSTSRRLVVKAYAGTGKTTLLVAFAEANPAARILYVAYNKAIREDADARFPRNVTCKTTHQLAYAAIGKDYRHKLVPNLRLRDIAEAVGTDRWALVQDIRDALHAFLISADAKIGRQHFPLPRGANSQQKSHQAVVVHHAGRVWERMCDVDCTDVGMTHDGYFKRYQLSQPDLSERYDIVLLDEAQDSNPCAEAVVIDQPRCRVVLAGDPYQGIYQFRGAQDAMRSSRLKDATVMRVASSFRFGERISDTANALLELRGETVPLRGLNPQQDIVVPAKEFLLKHSPAPQVTFLARTMMGVMQTALHFSRRKRNVHLVGGEAGYPFQDMEDIYWLSQGKKANVRNAQLLRDFKDYRQYREVAEETKDPEMLRAIKVLDTYPRFDSEMALLQTRLCPTPEDADIIVTTAHRAKGLEWDVVYLVDDFPDVLDDDMEPPARNAEINLLYVAATRARRLLAINSQLQKVLARRQAAKKRRRSTVARA